MMILKKHITNNKIILAICDSEIIGKKIEDDKFILNLDSDFYKGKASSEEEILKEIKRSSSIVCVGNKTTDFLLEKKIISDKNIKKINGIPYINIINL